MSQTVNVYQTVNQLIFMVIRRSRSIVWGHKPTDIWLWHLISTISYGKIIMGKSTISTEPFSMSQTVNVYQRVNQLIFMVIRRSRSIVRGHKPTDIWLWHLISTISYGKIIMGKSTISTGPFSMSQTVNVYQTVNQLIFMVIRRSRSIVWGHKPTDIWLWHLISTISYGKIIMGKSTISTGPVSMSQTVNVYQTVNQLIFMVIRRSRSIVWGHKPTDIWLWHLISTISYGKIIMGSHQLFRLSHFLCRKLWMFTRG